MFCVALTWSVQYFWGRPAKWVVVVAIWVICILVQRHRKIHTLGVRKKSGNRLFACGAVAGPANASLFSQVVKDLGRGRFRIMESLAGIGWDGGLGPPPSKSLMAGPSLSLRPFLPTNSKRANTNITISWKLMPSNMGTVPSWLVSSSLVASAIAPRAGRFRPWELR